MIRQGVFLIALLLLFATGSLAQGKKLKVYISADMEGIGGVSTWEVQASAKGREYEQFRRLITLEVNAAIAGAFDAGATEVLVSDSHGDAQNIDVELLDSRAFSLICKAEIRQCVLLLGKLSSGHEHALLLQLKARDQELHPDAGAGELIDLCSQSPNLRQQRIMH